jgi:hypothetical protein
MRATNRKTLTILGCALALGATLPAFAHHAAAVYYDLTQEVTMQGIVTEFRMGNPHARIYFDVSNADGSVAKWMAEGGSRTVMLRRGWSGDEVKVGDPVTIHGHPSRDGSNIVHMVNVDLADGTSKFAEDTDPDAIRALVERRRQRD